jgi:hypothetical protein
MKSIYALRTGKQIVADFNYELYGQPEGWSDILQITHHRMDAYLIEI